MDMVSNAYHRNLPQLLQSGQIAQGDIDESVRNVLREKFAMGLFDHPYADENKESSAMLRPESVIIARQAATQSLVLLPNNLLSRVPGLPLSPRIDSLPVICTLLNN